MSTPPLNVLLVFSRTQRGPRGAERGGELALPEVAGFENVVVDRDDERELLLGWRRRRGGHGGSSWFLGPERRLLKNSFLQRYFVRRNLGCMAEPVPPPSPKVDGLEPTFRHLDDPDVPWQAVKAQRNADGTVAHVWEKWLAFSPDPQYLTIYARYDPGMVVRRHGHFSPHVVFVLEGEVSFGDRRCPAGTHIELPLGAAFGPVVAGPAGRGHVRGDDGRPAQLGRRARGLRGGAGRAGRRGAARPAARVPRVAGGPAGALGRCAADQKRGLSPVVSQYVG